VKARVVIVKASRAERSSVRQAEQAAREAAMDAVCAPVRQAGDARRREAMARKVCRYAAITLAGQIGVKAAAGHLVSLAGQMFSEAEDR
jgi:hypothetical protein